LTNIKNIIRNVLNEASNDDIAEHILDYMTTTAFDVWYTNKLKDYKSKTRTKKDTISDIKSFFVIGDTRAERILNYMVSPSFDVWYNGKMEKMIQDDFPDDDYEARKKEVKKMFTE
jgi:hypothetical protein